MSWAPRHNCIRPTDALDTVSTGFARMTGAALPFAYMKSPATETINDNKSV